MISEDYKSDSRERVALYLLYIPSVDKGVCAFVH